MEASVVLAGSLAILELAGSGVCAVKPCEGKDLFRARTLRALKCLVKALNWYGKLLLSFD